MNKKWLPRYAQFAIGLLAVAFAVDVAHTKQGGVVRTADQGFQLAQKLSWQTDPQFESLRQTYASAIPAGSHVFIPDRSDRVMMCYVIEISVLTETRIVSERDQAEFELELITTADGAPQLRIRPLK